ncbi:HAD family hydrolase [Pseudomonas sp. PDM23]|uniref:rhamnan synthesis F family protein n=1 Tax=unclassified Pseudomonas TaxID=196821 RepID=UPI0017815CD5|nr:MULTISPECIES: rhamnan synthesis F family protein [unclassified Pseudomonas]MBD9501711.1 HAD family hydrolase [Pseudomonas sp. PDM17]MBD9576667.1 HAD family hydrolase [Pseudomonas sp. PDM23]MBD9670594.1 HAD family hydrolase [Pseudomonas sp. PDM21]
MQERQRAIVVLGMHRSGTSAIARGLTTLGVELGDNLMPAAQSNNERGFWEDQEIVDINTDILKELGHTWHSLKPLSTERLASFDNSELQQRALSYLREFFGDAPLFGLKDPRISLLLPFWLRVFEKAGIQPAFVLSLRHPLSVAHSLHKRDGFTQAKSLYLWLDYMLQGLLHSRGQRVAVLSYDRLMSSPAEQILRLAEQLGLPAPAEGELAEYIEEFLSSDLQHSRLSADGHELAEQAPSEVIECFDLLRRLADDELAIASTESQQSIGRLHDHCLALRPTLEALHQQDRLHSEALLEARATLDSLQFVIAKQSLELEDAQQRLNDIARLTANLEHSESLLASSRASLEEIHRSASWTLTKPLRFASRMARGRRGEALVSLRNYLHQIGRAIYWRIPAAQRERLLLTAYRRFGFAFNGLGHYERWKRQLDQQAQPQAHWATELTDIYQVEPCESLEGRIAIHLHMYYSDLAEEFRDYLSHMPFPYDLYVSVKDEIGLRACKATFANQPNQGSLRVEIVPNRGRDIAPMFCQFGDALKQYDYLLHLHSKKSLFNNGATDGWREYLCQSLAGSERQIRAIFELLSSGKAGIVYPQNFERLHYVANTWLANRAMGHQWCQRLGISDIPDGYFHFPAGSMFWASRQALAPLFEAGITLEDFAEEAGQTDGTFAHCLERLLVLTSQSQGLPPAILRCQHTNSWSAWRFDSYLARSEEDLQRQISNPNIKTVAFDIFDTLLLRPLLDPESIKRLTAQRVDKGTAEKYLRYRAIAEARAREKAGRDITTAEIFDELGRLAGIEKGTLLALRQREEETEFACVTPRPESIALLRYAKRLGKRVVLLSDMFLPQSVITAMLQKSSILQWDKLYISGEIGVRKDTGQLYELALRDEQLQPEQMLMVGDNERSDVQIPGDMGLGLLHVLKPIDLARGLPHWNRLVANVHRRDDLSAELALGLLLRRNFAKIAFGTFRPTAFSQGSAELLGYNVVGPLLTHFVTWLRERAQRDGIERLYFLSREGKLLKAAFDLWDEREPAATSSRYLVLSRRAVSVPRLKDFDDVLTLARPNYFAGTLENLLEARFGVTLTDADLRDLEARGLWKARQLLDIGNNNVSHIEPVLRHLLPRILAQAEIEAPALRRYLEDSQLTAGGAVAVVDVGYSGTIQRHLNAWLKHPVNGYYLVTDELVDAFAGEAGVFADGCFSDRVSRATRGNCSLFDQNFMLEQLLSADDAQVNHYRLDTDGTPLAQYQALEDEELAAREIRHQIQSGALAYLTDVLDVRATLHADFLPPRELARDIWSTFSENPDEDERQLLKRLVLDDHYCGRGLVS